MIWIDDNHSSVQLQKFSSEQRCLGTSILRKFDNLTGICLFFRFFKNIFEVNKTLPIYEYQNHEEITDRSYETRKSLYFIQFLPNSYSLTKEWRKHNIIDAFIIKAKVIQIIIFSGVSDSSVTCSFLCISCSWVYLFSKQNFRLWISRRFSYVGF